MEDDLDEDAEDVEDPEGLGGEYCSGIGNVSSAVIAAGVETGPVMYEGGDDGGDGGPWQACAVNRGQVRMASINSGMVILMAGSRVKILPKMSFSSSDTGRISFKNSGLRANARYVESSKEACFHGLRPQVRFTRITPRLQTSLGAHW